MNQASNTTLPNAFPAYANKNAFWHRLERTAAGLSRSVTASANGRNRAYHVTYPEFIRYFKQRPQLTGHDLLVAAAFTYAWMPRIIQLVPDEQSSALAALQAAHDGRRPSISIVESVAKFLAGSIPGASKLLHFAAPELYPIWDSRVANFLGTRVKTKPLSARVPQYLAYTDLCVELGKDERAPALCAQVASSFGSEMSPLRALELVLYLGGTAKWLK